jgi:hypothetical protein
VTALELHTLREQLKQLVDKGMIRSPALLECADIVGTQEGWQPTYVRGISSTKRHDNEE